MAHNPRPRNPQAVGKLPSGTVTFLFTDVEGSTRLLQETGDRYVDVLAEHRRVLRDAFLRHGGVEVDTQGDAFFVAFAKASDALAAADAATKVLEPGQVRVRMGLHTGEPLVTDDGYVGIDVHRAARIAAAGHGGQILVSQSTRDLAGPGGLRDLGEHRLKDLTAPERIYQFGEGEFPPLKSLNRTNLPVAATPLVGRERELGALRDLLGGDARLVTLTGAGGTGKTRLALQVAAELADEFREGVFFVSLAPVQDAAFVESTIAQAMGIREIGEIRDADTLLLLDNLEHLLPAAAGLTALLARAPNLRLLVTSRVRLRVAGEHEFALEPLPIDEAVAFFLERARAVKRDLRPDEAIAGICRRLDGLPLALELAASRIKVLEPQLLLERLDRRLPLLTGGARDAPERQQTLRATIGWSYELLEPGLQRAFRRLSVFSGSFSLEAAESVTETGFEELAALIDWSLVKSIGDARFLLLETIREYGVELLDQTDESETLRRAHLDYFLELAKRAEPELTRAQQEDWYRRLALEQDNVREALAHACDGGDTERASMLAGTIWRFWWTRGQISEAQHWYDRVLALEGEASPVARGRALFGAAHMAEARGETGRAREQFEAAADIFRVIDDTRWLILALTHLAGAYLDQADTRRAAILQGEALALAQSSGDVRGAAIVTGNLAYQLMLEGDDDRARVMLQEALDGHRVLGDAYGMASCLQSLAALALRAGDTAAATVDLRESLRLSSSIRDSLTLVQALPVAAAVALAHGQTDAAARLCAVGEALCAARGLDLGPIERNVMDETVERLRDVLGERFDRPWAAKDETFDLEDVVEEALRALD